MYLAVPSRGDTCPARYGRTRDDTAYVGTVPPGNMDHMRNIILRIYWDGQDNPSVEVPIGDFFGIAHGRQCNMNTEFVSMQGKKGFNCWIPMPFQKGARITVENDSTSDVTMFFYQIDFTLGFEGRIRLRFMKIMYCWMGWSAKVSI
jgi:hypothetical protein